MTYSPLTDRVMLPTGNKWSARPAGVRINGLNVHHWASTSMAGLNRLVYSSDPASANYLILNDGTLISSVPEQYRAWTTSSYANDDDKITVEIQNETAAPEWRISAGAMDTLVHLYADLAKRYGFTPDRAHIYGHRDYVATACPGPYLYPRLDDVARKAAALGTPTPEPEETGFMSDLTEAQQKAIFDEITAKINDGGEWRTQEDAQRVALIILRRLEEAEAARDAASRGRDADQRRQIAGLTAAVEALAKAQGLPLEQILTVVREAIENISITIDTDGA